MIRKFLFISASVLMISLSGNALASSLLEGREAAQLIPGADRIRVSEAQTPTFVHFSKASEPALEGFNQFLAISLKLSSDFKFIQYETFEDEIGMKHIRYHQTWKGIPVLHAMLIVHTLNNKVVSFNGEYLLDTPNSSQPQIGEDAARSKALQSMPANLYKWQIPAEEAMLKRETGDANATFFPKGELKIFISTDGKYKGAARLAYRFDVYAQEPFGRKYLVIDAENGNLLASFDRIQHIDAVGSATTAYSGVKSITTDMVTASSYRLRETGRGLGVETYNLNNGTNYGAATDFTDADNNWVYAAGNLDRYALDAHYGAEKTYDYFLNVHNRNSINNAGFAIKSYVHYSTNYVNAFWDGSRMTYGDGNATYTPLTSMDIVGHEITHGLTEYTANLVYSYQSGAINESYSDIFGTTIESYAASGTFDWLIGEDIGGAFRSMSNPNAFGDPDTYLGTNWYTGSGDNGGVHYNSGVGNYWYYLLVEGGIGTNDFGTAFNVSGLGLTDAGKIAFRALTVYLSSNSQYTDWRFYAEQAASDLFGACSNQLQQTSNAWAAVGVPATGGGINLIISSSGSTTFCSGSSVVLSTSNTSADSYQWYNGSNAIGGATGSSYTASASGNYSLRAVFCGTNTITSNTIAVNVSTASAVLSGNTLSCNGSPVTLSVNATPGYSRQWNLNGTPISGATGTTYSASTSGSYSVTMNAVAIPQSVYNSSGTTSIPDASCTGGTGTIAISSAPALVPSSIISVSVNITHTYTGDLSLILEAPNGDFLGLTNNVGGAGDNFTNTVFSDNGTSQVPSSGAPYTGTYKPWQSTFTVCSVTTNRTSFGGIGGGSINPNGNWRLRVYDSYGADVGVINSWAITIGSFTSPIPNCGPFTSNTLAVSITNPSAPVITAGGPTTFCQGGSVSLSSSYPSSNTWSTGSTTASINANQSGSYSVTYVDANSCSVTSAPVQVTVNPNPTVSISASGPVAFCDGGSVVLSANQSPVQWSNGATTQSITVSADGAFTALYTNANNCSATSNSIVVDERAIPVIGVTPNQTICNGNSVTLNATGASSYSWSPTTGLSAGSGASVNASPTTTTAYTVTGTDANGCTGSAGVSVTVNSCLPSTQLRSSDCGYQYFNMQSSIVADPVSGATQYEFEFRDITNTLYATRLQTSRTLALASVTPAIQWGTSYQVRVRAYQGSTAGVYGTSCTIALVPDPNVVPVPLTQLRTQDCGKLNFSLSSIIYANQINGATKYEFEFRNASATIVVATKSQTVYYTTLQSVVPALQWNTQYSVRARAYFGDSYPGNYGPACMIGTIPDPASTGIPNTQLSTSSCGATGLAQNSSISCVTVPNANLYTWEFSNPSTSVVFATRNTSSPSLVLNSVTPALQWGTSYHVRVKGSVSGVSGNYSTVCSITLMPDPALTGVPQTRLNSASCSNQTLTLTSSIVALNVAGATQYEFEFRNASATAVVATRISTSSTCFINQVVPALQWGTQYSVRVRAYIGTVAGSYGQACLIGFIPNPALGVPNTQLRSSDCGRLNFTATSSIVADAVAAATQYQFEITNAATSALVANVTQASRTLALSGLNPALSTGQYNVRVRAFIGSYQGNFGATCVIGIVSGSRQADDVVLNNEPQNMLRELKLFPNPSESIAQLILVSPDSEPIQVTIFDLGGRLVQSLQAGSNTTYFIGEQFESGVYIIRARAASGWEASTRMIKH